MATTSRSFSTCFCSERGRLKVLLSLLERFSALLPFESDSLYDWFACQSSSLGQIELLYFFYGFPIIFQLYYIFFLLIQKKIFTSGRL